MVCGTARSFIPAGALRKDAQASGSPDERRPQHLTVGPQTTQNQNPTMRNQHPTVDCRFSTVDCRTSYGICTKSDTQPSKSDSQYMKKRQYGNTTVNLQNPARFDTARSDDDRHRATPSDSQQTNIRKPTVNLHDPSAKSDCNRHGATPNVGTYYRHFHRMPSTLTDLSHRIHQPPPIASQPDAHQPSINHPPPNNHQPTQKTLGARPEEPDRAPSAMKGRKGESKKE